MHVFTQQRSAAKTPTGTQPPQPQPQPAQPPQPPASQPTTSAASSQQPVKAADTSTAVAAAAASSQQPVKAAGGDSAGSSSSSSSDQLCVCVPCVPPGDAWPASHVPYVRHYMAYDALCKGETADRCVTQYGAQGHTILVSCLMSVCPWSLATWVAHTRMRARYERRAEDCVCVCACMPVLFMDACVCVCVCVCVCTHV